MATLDELGMMTKIAKMYYEMDLNQAEIARRLGISQATVSRLYKRARAEGIIRISIQIPSGVDTELEEALVLKYGLKNAIVVDSSDDESQIIRDLGVASAYYVETIIKKDDVIGISSWSSTLLALLDAMRRVVGKHGVKVVQVLGGR